MSPCGLLLRGREGARRFRHSFGGAHLVSEDARRLLVSVDKVSEDAGAGPAQDRRRARITGAPSGDSGTRPRMAAQRLATPGRVRGSSDEFRSAEKPPSTPSTLKSVSHGHFPGVEDGETDYVRMKVGHANSFHPDCSCPAAPCHRPMGDRRVSAVVARADRAAPAGR